MDMDMEWVIDESDKRSTDSVLRKIFADLYKAFDNANTNDVEYILNTYGQTLLEDEIGYHGNGVAHLAAMFEYDCFDWILKSGGDINETSAFSGYTPLMIAVVNNSQSMVNTLLCHGVNLETVDREGHTALHLAIIYNQVEIAKLLISKQSNLNVQSRVGLTPLHLAAIHKQAITTKHLIDNGAHVNVLDSNTKSPLHHATESGSLPNVIALMKNGAMHNIFDSTNHSPLIYAIERSHDDIMQFFISSKVKVNLRGKLGKQPIHYAAKFANSSCLATLIAAGADIHSLDNNHNAPLAIAVAQNRPDNVRLLLHNNAQINQHIGTSILTVAMESNAVDIVMSLLHEGCKFSEDDKTNLFNFINTKVTDQDCKTNLLDMIINPASLKRTCRRVIRDTFTAKTINKLDELPLPTAILQYIYQVP
ncbi:unnamed protein product [Owenia fusiformis]|uniref:SOCS box domain-containing protein n=1 Tax=Owenia fusiformis TaxID=6347 RepID=A0A8S4NK03_OWEFU|nr:unnamed protein product [Owenia fusiformis]